MREINNNFKENIEILKVWKERADKKINKTKYNLNILFSLA